MLRHRNIDRICCIVLAATLLLTCTFMGAAAAGLIQRESSMGYEKRLFSQDRVHTIDIVMDDWEGFLDTCTNEEYEACTVVIDGEAFGSVAIRAKGNTSLSSVASYGNDRYSFKIEFDQYESGKSYYGLDKLSLNNLIQDATKMKDYLAYTLMGRLGAAAPLCSFVQVNVNGEAWGLYLAVEAVEDSFLTRNYGSDHGELYKPDSMSMGGGRGNGREFDVSAFEDMFSSEEDVSSRGGFDWQSMQDGINRNRSGANSAAQDVTASDSNRTQAMRDGFGGGMGSSDVMLQYIDDDPASYRNIFESAKTDVSEADQTRLIEALRLLSEGENLEEKLTAVDAEAVIRYLVVHNFMDNGDSYTGSMIHNYYLYEEDGALSMIPWDYNLSFGAFGMGGNFGGSSGATSSVNSPIDSPVSSGDISTRPILAWIFESEEYTALYHEIYREFIDFCQDGDWLIAEVERVAGLIAPYVEAEENGFFTYDEFTTATGTLSEYVTLRVQSIAGQLDGSIPSTTEGQRTNSASLIDASHINLNDMGSMNMGGGNRGGFVMPDWNSGSAQQSPTDGGIPMPGGFDPSTMQGGMNGQQASGENGMPMPGGFDPSTMQGGMNGQQASGENGIPMPGGFDPSTMQGGMNGQQTSGENSIPMPGGFDPSTMQGGMNGQQASGDDPAKRIDSTSSAAQQTEDTQESAQSDTTNNTRWDKDFSGKMPTMEYPTGDAPSADGNWIMLAVSIAVLLAGSIFAGVHKSGR